MGGWWMDDGWMVDGSTVGQQLEALTAAVGLILLLQQLRSLFQHHEPGSKFLSSFHKREEVNTIKSI